MTRRSERHAFTLIELLVVIAIIGLLVSILLPSLARAKDAARSAVCLSNLRSIGAASHQYASEDERNMIMPLHPLMVNRGPNIWSKKTVMWFIWGGGIATERFQISTNGGFRVNHRNSTGWYGADDRPLTRYMFPQIGEDESDVGVFRCPGDKGYPDLPGIDDAPRANAGVSMYDTVGNSYRGSLAQLVPSGVRDADRFSVGIWGQRLDVLGGHASELLWGGDPLFYNLIGSDSTGENSWGEVRRVGWHNEFMSDNELYADGGARTTRAVGKDLAEWAPPASDAAGWGIDPEYINWLSRGPGYQIDCYPTPGVKFGDWYISNNFTLTSWPFRGYTTTPPPED